VSKSQWWWNAAAVGAAVVILVIDQVYPPRQPQPVPSVQPTEPTPKPLPPIGPGPV